MVKLTAKQRSLLELLPDDRSRAGVYCHGPRFRLAQALSTRGLAEFTMRGAWVGGYFRRTDKGRALIKGETDGSL